jgi:hypothetical protein
MGNMRINHGDFEISYIQTNPNLSWRSGDDDDDDRDDRDDHL